MSVDSLKASVAQSHPSAYYILASKLYDEGEREEAVFWFYAGQLRYRTHLACNPDLPADGDPALFAAFSDVLGGEINRYAFGSPETLVTTIDAVIAWDQQTPNGFAGDNDCSAGEGILDGLEELKTYIVENADDIRAERAANGLENR